MKTKSIWGQTPSRLYRLIKLADERFKNENWTACIVGCSDGKFLIPFARAHHKVVGYDIDTIDLFGGEKDFPIYEKRKKIPKYDRNFKSPNYPLETRKIRGLQERIEIEKLEDYARIEERNFYENPPKEKFNVVFTSCSLHYTINNKFSLQDKINKLKNIVENGGILYIDYKMALEEEDFESFPNYKFFRNGEAAKFLGDGWKIISNYEQKKPVFEAAHVVTSYDHFHRFGYLLAIKEK